MIHPNWLDGGKPDLTIDVNAEIRSIATTIDALGQPLLAHRLCLLASQLDPVDHCCDDHCGHHPDDDFESGYEQGSEEMKMHIAEAFKTMPAIRDAILKLEL